PFSRLFLAFALLLKSKIKMNQTTDIQITDNRLKTDYLCSDVCVLMSVYFWFLGCIFDIYKFFI
ncbi:MAG TPA: hypothetical protein VI387_07645, partial [Candidatus Brocadiales bacterium]|nr:hypothetical protein [Candidatus Brocadiales bacterium]